MCCEFRVKVLTLKRENNVRSCQAKPAKCGKI